MQGLDRDPASEVTTRTDQQVHGTVVRVAGPTRFWPACCVRVLRLVSGPTPVSAAAFKLPVEGEPGPQSLSGSVGWQTGRRKVPALGGTGPTGRPAQLVRPAAESGQRHGVELEILQGPPSSALPD